MFGYVNISIDTISEEDKKIYGAYYCGLCKAIGEKSQINRIALSNDLTFLAILLSSVCDEDATIKQDRKCIAHIKKKHNEVAFNKVLDYASDMNMLLVYLKFVDDATDDKTLLNYIKKAIFSVKAKLVVKKYKKTSEMILSYLEQLSELERENCNSVDRTADCFAKILEVVFTPDNLGIDSESLKILGWIGYNIGRWIYIIDAYADMKKDKKSKNYNPFLCAENVDSDSVDEALLLTLANIANAYDLLDIKRNDNLLRNFIYSGLPEKQNYIISKTEGTDGSV